MTIEAEEDAVKVDNDDDTSVCSCIYLIIPRTIKAGDDFQAHASGDLIIDSGTYKVENQLKVSKAGSVTINGGKCRCLWWMMVSMRPMLMPVKVRFSSR